MNQDIYTINQYTFAYPDTSDDSGGRFLDHALTGISLRITPGEFIVLAGHSGCGKTTLLRQLKSVMTPYGRTEGRIFFCGEALEQVEGRKQASDIGFVMQDVDAQLVTDQVWHELAFGLESLGYENDYIRRRVAEMCSFFGLNGIFHKKVNELSGGQKQMVNLASVMAMNPRVLILDEPTSQLDPIAAEEFIHCLEKINRELGTAIIMTEHRLEEVLPICSRLILMQDGRILQDGTISEVLSHLQKDTVKKELFLAMPAAARIALMLGAGTTDAKEIADVADGKLVSVPVTVSEGRNWLMEYAQSHQKNTEFLEEESVQETQRLAAELTDIRFRYHGQEQDVLQRLSLQIYEGEILVINGSNGSGKSTLLSILAGGNRPYMGKVRIAKDKTVGLLPQDPKTLFTRKTVKEELMDAVNRAQLEEIIRLCRLEHLLMRHPYDLSGGEQQRLALARVLMGQPDLILMDEPTKGMDYAFKEEFREILFHLKAAGATIVIVSHDIEFCAETGDRAALIFDGSVASVSSVRRFFTGNSFYTTQAARIAREIVPNAVTVSDVVKAFDGNGDFYPLQKNRKDASSGKSHRDGFGMEEKELKARQAASAAGADIVLKKERVMEHVSIGRIITMLIAAAVIIYCYVKTISQSDLTLLISNMTVTAEGKQYLILYSVFICAVAVLIWAIRPFGKQHDEAIAFEAANKKLDWKMVLTIGIILIVIPFTIWFGYKQLHDKKYYFISLLVLIEAMIPFFLLFEKRKPKVREIVTIAVMCAIAVAGRIAFFMLPNFSPTMALVIISGVAFGSESGFITGAVTMLVSNMVFGQGPWTPWQMFAMGLAGFFSGLFFSKKGVRKHMMTKLGLCVFGALVCIVIYGGIMNPASVIMWQPKVTKEMIIAAYVTGFPFDVVQATATVICLWLAARPFLEKLDRIRLKYGVIISASK